MFMDWVWTLCRSISFLCILYSEGYINKKYALQIMSHLSSLVLVPHLSRTSLTYLVLNSKNARITELVIKKL